MTDAYGLTDSVRGDLSEDWFALVGRLVHVTALVEEQVLVVCSVVTGRQLVEVQRAQVRDAVSSCRSEMPSFQNGDRDAITSWLHGVESLRSYRHDIVHGLWPNETFSHRSPMSKRATGGLSASGRILVEDHSVSRLRAEVLSGVALATRGNEMAARAQSPRRPAH